MRTRLTRLALLLALVATPLIAGHGAAEAACGKQCREAKRYCENWEKRHPGGECGIVRGAACTGRSWKKIKQVNGAWSACRLIRGEDDLDKARGRCREYEKNAGGECQVHSPACNAGWVKLGRYGKFRACRRIQPSGSLLYDSYKAFMRKWEGSAGVRMPTHLQDFVRAHYSFDPARVRWGAVRNPHAACTTDCHQIYCESGTRIVDAVREGIVTDDVIFHELAHVEQCEAKGGRKKYAKMWFGDLPPGFFRALDPGIKDEFADKVHDLMPMEEAAERKAIAVMQSYVDGHYDEIWRCRLYRGDKVMWASEPSFRTTCESPSSPQHRKARSLVAEMVDRRESGTYTYTFGKKSATHHVIWTEKVIPRRASRPKPARAGR